MEIDRLEKALEIVRAKHPGLKTRVHWRPYFLNKNLPKTGVDKMGHYVEKFGKERAEKMVPMMKRTGKLDGINFSYGGKIGNTMDSHRLVHWASVNAGPEAENGVVEALFKRYFEQEKNIAEMDVLLSAAEEAGLDVAKVKPYLLSTDDCDYIDAEARKPLMTRLYRFEGVPHYEIGFENKEGEFKMVESLGGAQDSSYLAAVIETILEDHIREQELAAKTPAPAPKKGTVVKPDDKYSLSGSEED